MSDHEYKPTWKNRRRMLFVLFAFCIGVITYTMIDGQDTKLNDTLVTMSFGTLIAVSGQYIFGAAWDDKNVMKRGK